MLRLLPWLKTGSWLIVPSNKAITENIIYRPGFIELQQRISLFTALKYEEKKTQVADNHADLIVMIQASLFKKVIQASTSEKSDP